MTEGAATTAQEGENATITFVLLTHTDPDGSGSGTMLCILAQTLPAS
jgi:hypothetical protein